MSLALVNHEGRVLGEDKPPSPMFEEHEQEDDPPHIRAARQAAAQSTKKDTNKQ